MYHAIHQAIEHFYYTQVAAPSCDGLMTGFYELCTNDVMNQLRLAITLTTSVIFYGGMFIIALWMLSLVANVLRPNTIILLDS